MKPDLSYPRPPPPPRSSGPRNIQATISDPANDTFPTDRLIRGALGYVPSVARRYLGHGLDFDELVAAGNLGLVQAALRYDPERKVKFVTYADWWIRKCMLEAVENQVAPVRLPRYQSEKLRQLRKARAGWLARFGTEPTLDQLAMTTGLEHKDIESVLQLAPRGTSLDQPTSSGASPRQLRDVLCDPNSECPQGHAVRRDLTEQLLRLVAALPPREEQVILLRFGLGIPLPLTLRSTGRRMGLSRERVRQIELRALLKLRHLLETSAPPAAPGS